MWVRRARLPAKPAFHCGRNAGFSRQLRTHFQSHPERAIIIFADCKIVFSRKHSETARRNLQVTFGRVCLTACSESSSRREEALISLLLPGKFEPRCLGCYGKWRFSTGC